MTSPEAQAGQKYYEPAEVEAYVNDVTRSIEALKGRVREAELRAEQAERASGEHQPETASLGRAMLLAEGVADETVRDAEARATEILAAAEDRANAMVKRAQAEAQRLVDSAERAAADILRAGETRLLEALNAFVERSTVADEELARIAADANARTQVALRPGDQPRSEVFGNGAGRGGSPLVEGHRPRPTTVDLPEPPPSYSGRTDDRRNVDPG